MLRLEERERVETPKAYRRRVAVLCVEVLLARALVPCDATSVVREVAEHYGTEAAILASHAVLKAFDAGYQHGLYEGGKRQK